MCVWERLSEEEFWKEFLDYKIEKQHLFEKEQKVFRDFIDEKRYLRLIYDIRKQDYIPPIPFKKEISKADTDKKRVIYSFEEDFNILLKGIAFYLYIFDGEFSDNCYAFRRNYGVKDAIRRIKCIKGLGDKYCLKLDIHNYFNSIDVDILLEKLGFIKKSDEELYLFFEKLLMLDRAYVGNDIISEKRGAMAGTPISPFFANVYLLDMDKLFESENVIYFRYSDDILVFADSEDDIKKYQYKIFEIINQNKLTINLDKTKLCKPKEEWEFLGFSYDNGEIDLSSNTIRKMKAKIKRKAHALRRWADRKNLSGERAARGFIKAMNKKLYTYKYQEVRGTEFSWSRWFFPCITTDKGLKIIDEYLQKYIRYAVTGRHYKGNYKISYDKLKEWGYRNLINEYWNGRNES